MSLGSIVSPEMGKFSTARWVWAAYLARRGTWTSPIESCSMRNGASDDLGDSVMVPKLAPRPMIALART